MGTLIDPIKLTQDLIRCPSVTPQDEGALDCLQAALTAIGFHCQRLRFGDTGATGRDTPIDNLYAVIGTGAKTLAFAGHTDVVPPGDRAAWRYDPFAGILTDTHVFGRGAADMKGAIAAFVAAAAQFIAGAGTDFGRLALIITGDEEGPARNGTVKLVEWLQARGERIDACVVGEPTSVARLGDMIKNGRRGSLTAALTVTGIQGHTAYPQRADNPIHRLVLLLHRILADRLDDGTADFEPSTLQVTSIDVGNPASNVIPARATAQLNIRFNDRHHGDGLIAWLRRHADQIGGDIAIDAHISGEAFLTPQGPLLTLLSQAIEQVTGAPPATGTGGGTSDARFLRFLCPTVEFGLPGASMHKIDECAAIADIAQLTQIYGALLDRFFPGGTRK